jgi:hypothetical protein
MRLNQRSLLPSFVMIHTAGKRDNKRARELCAGVVRKQRPPSRVAGGTNPPMPRISLKASIRPERDEGDSSGDSPPRPSNTHCATRLQFLVKQLHWTSALT